MPEDRVLCREIQTLEPGELKRLSGRRTIDVLVGAPPCQGFSPVGFRSRKTLHRYSMATDDRNYLFEYMVGAALELKPRLFLMENVPGMKSAQLGSPSFLEKAAAILERKGGYWTAIWKLNAAAFGVPQERRRYFLVAARGKSLPAFPEADYQAPQQEVPPDALPPVTLDEAIFDLPERDADSGAAVARWTSDRATADKRFRRYLSKFRILDEAKLLYNHTVRYHNPRDLELYGLLRPGEDSVHFLERHQRADLMRYRSDIFEALLHGPEQIADLPVPVAESPGAVRIGHPERSHLVEYLAPNSVFNSLPRQRSSPHLRPDDRLVTIDRVLHHASLGVA